MLSLAVEPLTKGTEMRLRTAVLSLVLVMLLAVVPVTTSTAAVNQYVEDFTTRTYCDTPSTTVDWDYRVRGEVSGQLPPIMKKWLERVRGY